MSEVEAGLAIRILSLHPYPNPFGQENIGVWISELHCIISNGTRVSSKPHYFCGLVNGGFRKLMFESGGLRLESLRTHKLAKSLLNSNVHFELVYFQIQLYI